MFGTDGFVEKVLMHTRVSFLAVNAAKGTWSRVLVVPLSLVQIRRLKSRVFGLSDTVAVLGTAV